MFNNQSRIYKDKEIIKNNKELESDILDSMVDWVRVIDTNCNIIYSNRAMQEGVEDKSLENNKCYDIFGRVDACRRCLTETTIATGEISEKEEKIGERYFSMKSSPVMDSEGNIYAIVEVLRDITRERKLEKQIILKNEKMSRDINFARKIQRKLLPKAGNYKNINFDYIYLPSEMLSGDMFDIFYIDDEHIGFYISDVVGHGVTASIMTMFIKQTLGTSGNKFTSPKEAIAYLHENFLGLDLDCESYFTIFYGVMNTSNKVLKFVNGGHNSIPILARDSGIIKLEGTGFPIMSFFSKAKYKEETINLEKNDSLILYTDGLIEAKNKDSEFYGYHRLRKIVNNSLKDREKLIVKIKNDVDKFRYKELEDDFTLLQLNIN
ncbi:MAG: SpoIIE family protein phosphatase [Andreesenia angusta]|nr:SpoIIE family protein phosphatase [Andreesenia angusta]